MLLLFIISVIISTVYLNAKGVGELPQNNIQSEQSQSYFNFHKKMPWEWCDVMGLPALIVILLFTALYIVIYSKTMVLTY